MAQDSKVLRKYEVEVSNHDGINKVEIPDEVIENSNPFWEDFVVGKFLDLAPHVAKVHMVVNKIWKYGDPATKIEVYKINGTMMRFKVSSLKAREKILRRGMWNIVGVPMIVSKWSPKSEGEKQEEEAIPMGVHVEKVPLHMYSWQGLSLITSTVGFPVKLHPETVACTNSKEAKIFVKVDVSKALPKHITFTKGGTEFTVDYYYPWLPAKCKFCDKWGHTETVCAERSKGKKRKEENGSPNKESPMKVTSNEKLREGSSRASVKDLRIDVAESSEKKDMQLTEFVSVGDQESNEWAQVSPAKTGRNVTGQKVNEVQISASKYSVLSVNEEEEGEIVAVEGQGSDADKDETNEEVGLSEGEYDSLELQVREEVKVGKKRGRKAKVLDANSGKSTRPTRKKN